MIYLKSNGIIENFTKTIWWQCYANKSITNLCQLLIMVPWVIFAAFLCIGGLSFIGLGMLFAPVAFFIPELKGSEFFLGLYVWGCFGWVVTLFASLLYVVNSDNKICPRVGFK